MFQKNKLILLIALLFLTGCSAFKDDSDLNKTKELSSEQALEDKNNYKDYISDFKKMKTAEVVNLQNEGSSFFLYTGRETCPHCRIFVPKLHAAVTDHTSDITIYYLNSDDHEDVDQEKFKDKYQIYTVPDLSYFNGKNLEKSLDTYDDMSVEEIESFFSDVLM